VLGIVVFGSRGKGAYVSGESDWDVFVVLREHRGERPFVHGAALETVEVTLEELRNQPQWNR
jgi:predicted nucleotidyltransferase